MARPIDTKGPGWKILGSHSDARGPGGGRAVRAAARDPGQRPAAGPGPPNPLGENFGRPKNCNPAWPQIALRDTRRISAQGELLLPVYDGPRASGQRDFASGAASAAASGDCTIDRARRHRAAPRSSPAPCVRTAGGHRMRPLAWTAIGARSYPLAASCRAASLCRRPSEALTISPSPHTLIG